MNNCSRNTLCIDCDNTNCVFQGKKESDCPKWRCDRPDYAKLDCDHCGFIEKFIEDMRAMYNPELLKGEWEDMRKNISYTHSNGYTGILYGKSSLAVQNSEGREVFHTGFRNINTLDELKKWLDDFPRFMKMLNPYWSDTDD